MKFQNLLGMFSVLLIALSGPSYAGISSAPPASPPAYTVTPPPASPTPNYIPIIPFTPPAADTIAPTVLEPEGTESNCGGTVELCKKQGGESGSALVKKVIIEIIEMELLDAKENGKDLEKDFPRVLRNKNIAPWLLRYALYDLRFTEYDGYQPYFTGPERDLVTLAAQRSEFSLRTIKERLSRSANNPDCDANCLAYIEAKIYEVDHYHRDLVDSLNDADIPLLQSRIPG